MKKVLVVDDNELVGKLVAYHLGKVGCDVESCHSPFGVLQKVKDFNPDIVLLDMKMPGLSGRSVASLLRKGERGLKCKTIIFSSEEEHLQKQMVEEGLADGYFVKSHSFDGLKETMDRVFEA
jgi:DNA-binding response OmpR family regulator